VRRDRQRRRIASDLLAAAPNHRQRLSQLGGGHAVDVQLVRKARRQPPGHVGAVAADHDRDARLLDRLGDVDRVLDPRVPAVVRGVHGTTGDQHPADHLEGVTQGRQPFVRVGEAVTVSEPLVALPAGTDPELHPAAADHIHCADHFGHEGRVAEPVADHDLPKADPQGQRSEGGERRERLERDLVGGDGDGVQVVEEPDRFEREPLGLLRHPDGARPGALCRPAVVFAGPALGNDHADTHAALPARSTTVVRSRSDLH
jgi:hypothetical protein